MIVVLIVLTISIAGLLQTEPQSVPSGKQPQAKVYAAASQRLLYIQGDGRTDEVVLSIGQLPASFEAGGDDSFGDFSLAPNDQLLAFTVSSDGDSLGIYDRASRTTFFVDSVPHGTIKKIHSWSPDGRFV